MMGWKRATPTLAQSGASDRWPDELTWQAVCLDEFRWRRATATDVLMWSYDSEMLSRDPGPHPPPGNMVCKEEDLGSTEAGVLCSFEGSCSSQLSEGRQCGAPGEETQTHLNSDLEHFPLCHMSLVAFWGISSNLSCFLSRLWTLFKGLKSTTRENLCSSEFFVYSPFLVYLCYHCWVKAFRYDTPQLSAHPRSAQNVSSFKSDWKTLLLLYSSFSLDSVYYLKMDQYLSLSLFSCASVVFMLFDYMFICLLYVLIGFCLFSLVSVFFILLPFLTFCKSLSVKHFELPLSVLNKNTH